MDKHVTLGLVVELLDELEQERIEYCHWKSTNALDLSATGENDLDLLVDRGSAQRFTEILWRLGFKEAALPPQRQVPGIRDFYGYDSEGCRSVHVHAHYKLVLGHDATKNYRLPIEQAYLASSVQGELFRVPAPEFEYVVLVIRMALKHLTWDAALLGQGSLSAKEQRELEYLAAQIDKTKVQRILAEHLPYIDCTVFEASLHAFHPGCSRLAQLQAGRRLENSLEACARRPATLDAWLRPWRQFSWKVQRRVRGRVARRQPTGGGLLIGIIGGDGAGKSTQIEALGHWLSERFEVTRFHLGKPDWSALTVIVRGVLSIGRMLGLYGFAERAEDLAPGSVLSDAWLYPSLIRAVCTARDRYRAYARARRLANNGGLVICDRYPLPGILSMDGPQVARRTGNRQDERLIRLLTTLEERYYRRIAPPDTLIVLRVHPDICAARKTDETAASVRARSSQVWAFDWQKTSAHVIDAGRPQAQVFADLQAHVWSIL
jgi:thymidylate kinase